MSDPQYEASARGKPQKQRQNKFHPRSTSILPSFLLCWKNLE